MIDTTMRKFMEKVLRAKGFDPETADLRFGINNSKLDDVITFSIPAGHSCLFAKDCRSCAIKKQWSIRGRKRVRSKCGLGIQDGPYTKVRCFAAIDEVMKPGVRESRWWNFLTLLHYCKNKNVPAISRLIERSLPKSNSPVRIDVSGDFFNLKYFNAWITVAKNNPSRLFYCYTKALPYWVYNLKRIPNNFILTASYGGTHDWMIKKYNLKSATIVKSPEEARRLKLPIDHNDIHAMKNTGDFALLIHGVQKAGTEYSKAWQLLKKSGAAGYGKHKKIFIKQ